MVKADDNFVKGLSERVGTDMGDLYINWHDKFSTELSYRWLSENNLTADVILELKYQKNLSIYLVEQFINWFKELSNGGE